MQEMSATILVQNYVTKRVFFHVFRLTMGLINNSTKKKRDKLSLQSTKFVLYSTFEQVSSSSKSSTSTNEHYDYKASINLQHSTNNVSLKSGNKSMDPRTLTFVRAEIRAVSYKSIRSLKARKNRRQLFTIAK